MGLMHPHATISRALGKLTVDTHRRIHSRTHAADYYELAERWHQFQYQVKGTVGMIPVETTVKVLFDVMFLFEYGLRRDSQLNEPQSHFGFTSLSAPPGTFPYAHVQTWIRDEDLNFVGAHLVVGAHNPAIAVVGAGFFTSSDFSATLHCSFQGYGVPIDGEDPIMNPSSK